MSTQTVERPLSIIYVENHMYFQCQNSPYHSEYIINPSKKIAIVSNNYLEQ
jgi:hypothetical protein